MFPYKSRLGTFGRECKSFTHRNMDKLPEPPRRIWIPMLAFQHLRNRVQCTNLIPPTQNLQWRDHGLLSRWHEEICRFRKENVVLIIVEEGLGLGLGLVLGHLFRATDCLPRSLTTKHFSLRNKVKRILKLTLRTILEIFAGSAFGTSSSTISSSPSLSIPTCFSWDSASLISRKF